SLWAKARRSLKELSTRSSGTSGSFRLTSEASTDETTGVINVSRRRGRPRDAGTGERVRRGGHTPRRFHICLQRRDGRGNRAQWGRQIDSPQGHVRVIAGTIGENPPEQRRRHGEATRPASAGRTLLRPPGRQCLSQPYDSG